METSGTFYLRSNFRALFQHDEWKQLMTTHENSFIWIPVYIRVEQAASFHVHHESYAWKTLFLSIERVAIQQL